MYRFIPAFAGLLLSLLPLTALANDSMFPPAPAAKPFINIDGKGFLIHGKRTFIVSGSLHYARVPRALWADRLLRMKRAGFNTVQSYLFWNVHEPEKGVWNFQGRADLDAFLKLVKQMGLYATCRVGPYYCAEWDSGGYPVWLRFVPGLRVREPNTPFEQAVGRFFDKLLPIVAKNQINHGGSVILVQLENEHPLGWGTDMPNAYFQFLYNKAIQNGIQVPFFFSGLHHSSDPAGNKPWSSAGRTSPWYCTEFWPGWYNLYGVLSPDRERYFTRGTWKIIAYGGNGYNYYMLHGGSNFGYTNNDEDAASYDYAGAIGQAGDLRPIYYQFKRAAWFARSFAPILENSDNSTDLYAQSVDNASLKVTARTAPTGTLLFLDNPGNTPETTRLTLDGKQVTAALDVAAGEIRPIVLHYSLLPSVALELSLARIYAICQQANITTIVVNGPTSEQQDRLVFQMHGVKARPILGRQAMQLAGNVLTVRPHYPVVGAESYAFQVGHQIVRLLAVSEQTADRTWFVEVNGHHDIIIGPRYVGEVHLQKGHLWINAERPASASPDAIDAASCVYGASLIPHKLVPLPLPPSSLNFHTAPKLAGWQASLANREAAPSYSTVGWLKSEDPVEMGADGYNGAYAWYRATLEVPKAGVYTLHFSDGGDWLDVFINGQKAAESRIVPRTDHPVAHDITVNLPAGRVTLAVLTAHYGRPKRFSYLGPLDTVDVKGLKGPVTLIQGALTGTPIQQWYWKATTKAEAVPQSIDGTDWQPTKVGEDLFHGRRGYVWVAASLPNLPGAHHLLHFEDVDDNGDIYLNGKFLLRHEGWGSPFDVNLDSAWNPQGSNLLMVRVQNTDGPGGIMGAVTLRVLQEDQVWPIKGWAMHGGIGENTIISANTWRSWPAAQVSGVPTFYKTAFTYIPPKSVGPHPILRFSTQGLSRGFVWLNGHNLGRYPEKVPIDGYYLPECWLKPGRNELVVFDEEGNAPEKAHLWIEVAASRTVYNLTEAGRK